MKVLVVDDTKNIRTLLTKCLELEGYAVKTAEDGKIALDLIKKEHFDLAFLDIKMPLLSGTEVLRRIRDMGVAMPIIIVTAYATVKNAVDCTQLGAVAYLQKPFTAEKIKAVLYDIMKNSTLKATTAASAPRTSDSVETADNLEAIFIRAESLISGGDCAGALSILRPAMCDYPFSPQIFSLLAQVSERLGNSADAEKYRKLRDAIE